MKQGKKMTTADIKRIELGQTLEWVCPTPRDARNAQSLCNYVKEFCEDKPKGVTGYKTARNGRVLTIQAI